MVVNINPEIFKIGNIHVRWYGLMYVIGFIISLIYLHFVFKRRSIRKKYHLPEDLEWDIVIVGALGVLLGGRLGFVLFYNLSYYLHNPLKIFAVYEGGMSFHGGMLGAILSIYIYTKIRKIDFFAIADPGVVIVPIGLFFGRIGNFINGELYGRPTNLPWAMIFPRYDPQKIPRHPSQLYEAFLEGIVLFLILYFLEKSQHKYRKIKKGVVFWSFVLFYGIFRFIVEFFREPDKYFGNNGFILGPFTMGQILSFPMIIVGGLLIYLLQTERIVYKDIIYNNQSKSKKNKKTKKNKKR